MRRREFHRGSWRRGRWIVPIQSVSLVGLDQVEALPANSEINTFVGRLARQAAFKLGLRPRATQLPLERADLDV